MRTFGWRLCSGSFVMELKQFDNSQVAKVAANNPHHDTTRTTASQLVELPIMEFR
jgi:hypothetical protein